MNRTKLYSAARTMRTNPLSLVDSSPTDSPPKPIIFGLALGTFALTLDVWALYNHFKLEMANVSQDCQMIFDPILWSVILLQIPIPAFLLYKLARGWLWARNTLVIFLIAIQSILIYGAINRYFLKTYLFTDSLLLLTTLFYFLPASTAWFQRRTKKLSPIIAKPWPMIAGLVATGIALIFEAIFTFGSSLFSIAFAMGDGGYFRTCPILPWDRLSLLAFWYSLPYQVAFPGALLLFAIAARRRWALWLHAIIWTSLSAFAAHLAITLREFDFLIGYVLVAIGVVEACSILFFVPPSARWFKTHAA